MASCLPARMVSNDVARLEAPVSYISMPPISNWQELVHKATPDIYSNLRNSTSGHTVFSSTNDE